MDHPESWFFLVVFVFGCGELRYEVCQCLDFYGCHRSILYVKLTKLNGPLYHLSYGFGFVHGFLDGLVCHYYGRVCLKVQTKLLGGHHQGEHDFLHARVPGFNSLESLANVIH